MLMMTQADFLATCVATFASYATTTATNLSLLTLGELCSVGSAPFLWFLLLIGSLFGRPILYYFDPVTMAEANSPIFHRPERRFYAQQDRRHTRRYARRCNDFVRKRTIRQNKSTPPGWRYSASSRQEGKRMNDHCRRQQSENRNRNIPVFPNPVVDSGSQNVASARRNRWRQRRRHRAQALKRFTRSPHQLNLDHPLLCRKLPTVFLGEAAVAAMKAATQHPRALCDSMKKEDTFTIIWDSGASNCISFDRNDFVGPLQPVEGNAICKGITNGLRIEGVGHVLWSVLDTSGQLRHLKLPAYFIPKLRQRLLSTTVFKHTYPNNKIIVDSPCWTIEASVSDPLESALDVYINPINNLPSSTCFRYDGVKSTASCLSETVNVTHTQNANLSEPEKELLRWHQRFGHIGFKTVQFLMRSGALSFTSSSRSLHTAASKIRKPPRCAVCQYGKQHSHPVPAKTTRAVTDRAGILYAFC